MKLKSLLFGSAAVLAAGTGAQAADLPTAEPVEYVRICDAFGTGFFYIPGTDTCLQISGRVRVDATYVDDFDEGDDDDDDDDDDDGISIGDDFFGIDQNTNNYATRARGNIRLDARTQTDLGLIRAFIGYEMQVGHGGLNSSVTNYSDQFALNAAFIQISNDMGTFTAGHSGSFFDFFGSYGFGSRIDVDDPTTEATLFAYTFGGGNGFSATLSLEDAASAGRRRNGSDFFIGLEEDYEGQEWPDLVGNVRLDQGWGALFLAGVLHHIHDKEGHPEDGEGPDDDDALGWGVTAGAEVTAGIFSFATQASYADGATGYITNDPGGVGDLSAGDDDDDDDESVTNNGWSIRAGVKTAFTPTVSWTVDGSYTDMNDETDDDDASDDSYRFWVAKTALIWNPVPGLIMGPEVAYANIDFDGDDDDDDDDDDLDVEGESDDVWGVMWRIQRDF